MFSENSNYNTLSEPREAEVSVARSFMTNVFMWMFMALGVTALTSYYFSSDPSLMLLLRDATTGGMTILGWIVMLSPIGFVMLMSLGFQRFSAMTLTLLFAVYAVLMGMSLSFILLIYTGASVAATFGITSAMFGIMAVAGYTTKIDLTRFGSIMMMGLVGIIIASLVNMFMQSGTLDYIISFVGVLVFTGLIAYDVQKLKRLAANITAGDDSYRKYVVMGALTLYLDFINLFLFLLRFLGNRR
ncbi:MAG: Bax inhibitor-1/YccA family protein [Bacteroidales bacterium]